MSTVNRMMSTNYTSKAGSAAKNEIAELRNKIKELAKDTSLTAQEKTDKRKEYTEKIDELAGQMTADREAGMAAAHNNAAGLFSFNGDQNQSGFDVFFGAGASIASLKSINSARINIENRARTLMSEIRMDNLRGVDTSLKREQLSNLTANLSIMNKNLSDNIDKAVKTPVPKEIAETKEPDKGDKVDKAEAKDDKKTEAK